MNSPVPRFSPADVELRGGDGGANPFLVQVSAVVTGPHGTSMVVPGFYDGDGVWKIRFCPNVEGTWGYVTHSADPELDGQRGEVRCVASENSRVHGALMVDPQHPHHFLYEDGTRPFVLGYEANWLWALTHLGDEEVTLRRFLDRIASFGFNHIFVNTYAHDTRWCPGKTEERDYGPPPMYAWEGTNEAPDHLHLNPEYWRRFDAMMDALLERGLTAHIFLKVYNKQVNWPDPYSAGDELFFRYVVARYQGFSNVVWDFSKEAKNEPDKAYLASRLSLMRALDGHRRLVTVHDDDVFYWDARHAGQVDFVTDQYHRDLAATLMLQRRHFGCPIINEEYAYECGPGGLDDKTYPRSHTAEEHALQSWEVAFGGGYPGYYYTYTAWDVIRPDDEPPGYALHQRLVEFMRQVEWWELEPHMGMALGNNVGDARCLANPGREYLVFGAAGRALRVTLPGLETGRDVSCEWLQPLTGERGQTKAAARPRLELDAPFSGPYVVRIRPSGD